MRLSPLLLRSLVITFDWFSALPWPASARHCFGLKKLKKGRHNSMSSACQPRQDNYRACNPMTSSL